MKRKIISMLLIIAGILIAVYPVIKDMYTGYMQEKLLREWEEGRTASLNNSGKNEDTFEEASNDAINSYLGLEEAFSDLNETEETDQAETVENSENKNSSSFVTLGVIKIDKINLVLPVLDGATPEILKIGAGKLTGTTDIGKIGNTAISAHRSHKYGRNFNRLNELEEGDIVVISTLDADYTYEVFNIQVVEPNDVSLLKKSKSESILTLITCHPLYIASHRLIVQARLVSVTFRNENMEN